LFANDILDLWINPTFAAQSAPMLSLFAIGIFINCLAHVPLTLLQGAGQARVPSLLQAAQLLPYVGLMWWLTSTYGVIAAAWLWAGRMAFDTALMFRLCAHFHAAPRALRPSPVAALAACLAAAGFAVSSLGAPTLWRAAVWAVVITSTALLLKPWRQPDAPLNPCLSKA
jgi:O-antigen/teichoic acid export membrane protein